MAIYLLGNGCEDSLVKTLQLVIEEEDVLVGGGIAIGGAVDELLQCPEEALDVLALLLLDLLGDLAVLLLSHETHAFHRHSAPLEDLLLSLQSLLYPIPLVQHPIIIIIMDTLFSHRTQEIDSLLYLKTDSLSQGVSQQCQQQNESLFAQCFLSRHRLIDDTMDIYETKKLYR